MVSLAEINKWYSDRRNISGLAAFLTRYIHPNGVFFDADDAGKAIEDVISETWIKLAKAERVDKGEYICKTSTLIFKCAKRNALTEIRKRIRSKTIPISMIERMHDKFDYPVEFPDDNEYVIENAESGEFLEIIRRDLRLHPYYRDVFELLIKDYKIDEISKKLGIPAGTVKSRTNRLKKRISKIPEIREAYAGRVF